MKRFILGSALVVFGFSLSNMGCSQADAVCELICECEHCNDQNKVESCNLYETAENVASAYDCTEQWDAYAQCIQDKGTCDQKEARFSTRDSGGGQDKCDTEQTKYNDCIDKASAHQGTPGQFN